MKAEELFYDIGDLDDKIIENVPSGNKQSLVRHFVSWGALAACFVLVAALSMQSFEKEKSIQKEDIVKITKNEETDIKKETQYVNDEIALKNTDDSANEKAEVPEQDTSQIVSEIGVSEKIVADEAYSVDENAREDEITNQDSSTAASQSSVSGGGGGGSSGGGSARGAYTLSYLTGLQNKISEAMNKGEIPFVITSTLLESENRIEVVVSTNDEAQLNKILNFDEIGGAIIIKNINE